ncbi:hypothetical protein RHMOL_Rhmol10G0091900 [Rhododendron molle]|uniref:Uncharacterized protein n=1 Tax=Rhododendron molle TaxID=49168 RepID=A0ACC0M0R6_RHOML|nr:hypothetical protein RHMOL_Rhmol10G0091900 [Rhododendron molle]
MISDHRRLRHQAVLPNHRSYQHDSKPPSRPATSPPSHRSLFTVKLRFHNRNFPKSDPDDIVSQFALRLGRASLLDRNSLEVEALICYYYKCFSCSIIGHYESLPIPCTQNEGGQAKGMSFWIWYLGE